MIFNIESADAFAEDDSNDNAEPIGLNYKYNFKITANNVIDLIEKISQKFNIKLDKINKENIYVYNTDLNQILYSFFINDYGNEVHLNSDKDEKIYDATIKIKFTVDNQEIDKE